MSYFGNEGPPQDGGFISGIARGSARLHNAKVTRARYQKGIGQVPAVVDTDNWRWVPGMSKHPSDSILYKRTTNFNDSYDQQLLAKQLVKDGRHTQAEIDPLLKQYEEDKQLIAQWAESGPYVHEGKAFALGIVPIGVALGAYWVWSNWRATPRAKGHKSALYAVFS